MSYSNKNTIPIISYIGDCLNEVEERDGMSSASQSFWLPFSTKK